jgi:hypothetical protein
MDLDQAQLAHATSSSRLKRTFSIGHGNEQGGVNAVVEGRTYQDLLEGFSFRPAMVFGGCVVALEQEGYSALRRVPGGLFGLGVCPPKRFFGQGRLDTAGLEHESQDNSDEQGQA